MYKEFENLSGERKSKIKMHIANRKNKIRDNSFKNLTPNQTKLYNEVMIGLNYYSGPDKYKLSEKKKKAIHYRFKKAQSVLNLWKQNIMIGYTNYLFEKYDAKFMIDLCEAEPTNNFDCRLTFQELNVTRTDIIKLLIGNNLLPSNFAEL
jgi:hypothetical protein